ncbi:uncharacterized protein Bfra_007784 [Botrytis fragariae]|uniref:Uncharacterized protein n=1 Tax=Botrytis fragariae TaxID=1964551 RepID=A0A8H6API9_9HELO|nr:uncharacterized protein Bfra_007784 [Botrytis fragariae]KAF5871269.1 hypothetical protein Bfra_007784 [Botrytis fragariae]
MSQDLYLTPPDSAPIMAASLLPVADYTEEKNVRENPEFKMALRGNGIIKLHGTSPVEDWNQKKRKRQDLDWSHRKANIPSNGYGLTKEEMKTYREGSDKFENILAAHAASGGIPYVVDLKLSLADYTRLFSARDSLSARDSICESDSMREKLPTGDSLLASLKFLERWSRLTTPVFSKTKRNPTIDKWNENIKEQDLALRESAQWGPLCKLYEQWAIDETNFYEPQHDSLDSLDFDSD